MRALLVLVTLVLATTSVSAVHAQVLAPGARPLTIQERLLLREQWVREREYERSQIRIGGPIVGVLLGAAVLGTSMWMIASDPREGGIVLALAVGVPVTAISTAILARRAKRRRAITREIWNSLRSGTDAFLLSGQRR